MANFNEHSLEMSIMDLFQDEGYIYLNGEQIHRERSEVLLIDDLRKYLLNRYASEGLTPSEVDSIILRLRSISGTIYEANKAVCKMICDGFIFNREDHTKKDIFIELIDFDEPEKNVFKIVNQFEIEGINNQLRIPDGIVFINGIPVVVLEFKSAVKENTTIMDAYTQLTVRYRRDIPELFKYNAFIVISDGANNKYGSFFSPYDFFYAWRKIEADDKELDGINSLVTMVSGLFRKERLLAVIKDFVYFPDSSDKDLKIVCRYPQYFAAVKLFENIKAHLRPEGDGKGGTYFGATGCGKSYTMLFLTRMLMKSTFFHSPTILIITDRTDLDDQLSKQFVASKKYIGDETVVSIDSREKLRQELQGRASGGVYMTTIQKFTEDLELLTDRANVICISDEAHRSQINLDQKVKVTAEGVERSYGFAKYLHDSLPNATYVGFTGTPVDGTIEVFGPVVDAYTMTEAVKDGITVNLVYDGRAARVTLDQAKVREIEDYYDRCAVEGANEHQIEESQKAVAHIDAIIGDPDRLHAVAEDFINHYETRVAEGATVAGKAMFVCSNRKIAYAFYQIIVGMRPEWAEKKVCPDGVQLTEKEKKELKPIEKIKLIMTRNKDDEPELYEMLGTKDDRKEFDRQFKNVKSNFKIAIVVDMWLTGFDVPALDTIYIDKPIQQHSLIQTISRVNRVYTGKDKGLIVDYIGIKKNMNLALKKYTNFESDEFEGVEQSITIVKDQLDVLAQMFHNFNSTDYFNGSPKEQLACLNQAVEYVQLTEDLETRFMAAVKRMKQAFNLCSSSEAISDKEKDYLHFYCAVRSILFKLTKGDAPDISQMNARVRELLEGAIQSDGIEELFETGKHISVDIFSDEYLDKINAIQLPNTKIKVLQRLLSQELLTDRANVICISDEAHRSQINLDQKVKVTAEGVERSYGFAKYLHDSLPNATYVGFTGTPVDGTIEVFGPVVDAYTMTEAVKDGITVNLVYDGRAARVTLDQAKVREIEDYYDRCAVEGANEHQIEESQKAVAHIDAIIGDPDRLHAVAEDFINHYETRVAEGATVAGKAMFVCSNRKIAYAFYQIIVGMRPEWAEKKVCPDGVQLTEKEKKELKPIEKIKLIMTRNKDDEPELYEMLGTKDDRKEFDRQFKNVKSNFKIAIVVDMWLTGFDVPALDTIYIDKPIQQHSLIQTISRVNRVYTGKDKGLIVDYIGIKKNMNLALKKYTNFESDEFEGVEQSITIVKDQLDVLAQMFHNFNSTDYFNGSPKEQLACLNQAVEYVQLTEDLETRFMAAVKRMKQAFNLCSSSEAISDKEKDYLHFYCAVRSILFKLTKGDAPDISQMNARVRELLEGAIQSDGIEELFETGKHISVDIFSDEYLDKINAIQLPNTKIKVLQRLLSQAIDEYKKVNRIMGMEFSDRLKRVVDEYNNRRRDEAFANEVLDDVAEQLAKLLEELKKEKDSFKGMGIDYEEKAFYDILKAVAKKYEFEYPDDKMIELSKRIKIIVDDKAKYTDWSTRDDIKANLQVDLILLLDEFDYPPVTIDDVYKEVLEQAENFKKYAQ